MKRLLLGFGTIFFAISLIAIAQVQGGQGPRAWCDRDKDGKCDFTGQPVGQGRGMSGMRQGQGCGRHGCGQQSGCSRRGNCPAAQSTNTPAPAPAPEPKK